MEPEAETSAQRPPGRPRSVRAHQSILDAALQLLTESGFEGMSIEAVAARAGVGKTTIYRRWDSKEELVADAIERLRGEEFLVPDTGNFLRDVGELVGQKVSVVSGSYDGRTLARLIGAAASNPRFMDLYWKNYVSPRREALARAIERAKERGEIRADADAEMVMDLIGGALLYRLLVRPEGPEPEEYLRRALKVIRQGIEPTLGGEQRSE